MRLAITIFLFSIAVAIPVGHQEKVGIIRPLAQPVQTRNEVNQHCPSAKWSAKPFGPISQYIIVANEAIGPTT
jgi:hypothetical protein